jgi:phage tail sheath protein FI
VSGALAAYDATTIDTLADAHVSGITRIAGQTLLYGWRSLSANTDQWALLNARDGANTLTDLVEAVLQPFIFETIDGTGQLTSRIQGALTGILQPIEDAGGIVGKYDASGSQTNPAYTVTVGVSGENSISATVVVRFAGMAESITVSIVKAAFNSTI